MTLSARIYDDFRRGLTFVGLARKYGRPRAQIEAIIRKVGKPLWKKAHR